MVERLGRSEGPRGFQGLLHSDLKKSTSGIWEDLGTSGGNDSMTCVNDLCE